MDLLAGTYLQNKARAKLVEEDQYFQLITINRVETYSSSSIRQHN